MSGWESIRVTRGIERFPSDFDITMSEPPNTVLVHAGDACTVRLGRDLVLTGYVDRRMPSIGPRQHQLRVSGRGKCQDLADCHAISPMVILSGSMLAIARNLATPFGITVSSLTGDEIPVSAPGGLPVQFSVLFTETPYEIIERVGRYTAVLVYEDTDGGLLLSGVGASAMASGFTMPGNVQSASALDSMDERFSEYHPSLLSADQYWQFGVASNPFPVVYDSAVPRYRPLYVVSEQLFHDRNLAQIRAIWERNRRFGRSMSVRITCDSWRDSSGQLWRPNASATIYLPQLGLTPKDPWIIGEVSFLRDIARGTIAELTLMPRQAFVPEPVPLVIENWQIARDLQLGGAANPTPGP